MRSQKLIVDMGAKARFSLVRGNVSNNLLQQTGLVNERDESDGCFSFVVVVCACV